MAAVTYNGIEGASGGNIFKDMIFWVAQRVPMRNHIVDLVKTNGGQVVSLEKDAHMLIADHARKDAPSESYSWKYITESVDNGIAQLTDHYRIWGHPEEARPRAGGSAPVKNTRTPFTAADDAALANWVLSHAKGQTGNKIYQEFEETHSWHTWQSWRNRFAKKLMLLPRADLERLAMSAAELAVQDTAASNQSRSKPATPNQQTPVKGRVEKSAENPPKFPPKKTPAQTPAQTPKSAERLTTGTTSAGRSRSNVPNAGSAGGQATGNSRKSVDRKSAASAESTEPEMSMDIDALRDTFYSDLAMFIEDSELDINPQPVVANEMVDLWDLSQAIASQKVPMEEVDWMKVAEDLDYDWVQNKRVPGELQKCYQYCLADFFEAMDSFPVDDDETAGELVSRPDLLTLGDDIPSSPPLLAVGQKRSRDLESRSSAAPSTKRRRLSKDAEIPSTPEDKLGVAATISPSVQRAMQLRGADKRAAATSRSQRIPAFPAATDGAGSDEEQAEGDEIVFETQVQPVARLETQQSTFEVTPSQQLRSEALEISPLPLHLKETSSRRPAEREAEKPSRTAATKPASRRSLPSSFHPSSNEQPSPREAESRAQKPSRPSRPQRPTEEGASQSISETIEFYEMFGYPRSIVVESLMRTTMTPGWPASYVMERLKAKEGVPTNIEGVWTDRDDKSLRYADAVETRKATANTRELNKAKKELDRIVHKHTQERVDLRRQFLEAQATME